MKILKNVFLNTHYNFLIPVNIIFDTSIRQIERLTVNEFSWKDIDSISKRDKIISQIETKNPPSGTKIHDGKFNLIMPGAIDPHVHFDTPGFEFRDTFEHGTTAAAFGGVTTVIDMPCTSLPPVTSVDNLRIKQEAVKGRALIDYAFWGGVCGNDFDNNADIERNIIELSEAGVASYKAYFISGMDSFTDLTFNQMKWTAEKIAETGKPLGVHAEDKNLIESRRSVFKSNNENSWEYYCKARDVFAEEAAVNEMVAIAGATGAKVHIVHLSSKSGLKIIEKAQKNGLEVSAETCPHYLHFTQNDFNKSRIRNYLKTAPPVKHPEDMNALWKGLSNGSLLFVTTDHAGCDPHKEKISENFWEVYGGIPGVEHRVPFLFSEGFHKEKLSLAQTINLLSTNAAHFFNLTSKGRIEENYDADFALIDLWKEDEVKADKMHSKGSYTPFEGLSVNAAVNMTFLRGNVVMNKLGESEKGIGYGCFIEVDKP